MTSLIQKICLYAMVLSNFTTIASDKQPLATPEQRIAEIKRIVEGENKDEKHIIEQLQSTNDPNKYPEDQYVTCFKDYEDKERDRFADKKKLFLRLVHINKNKVGEKVTNESAIGKIVRNFFESTRNKQNVQIINYEIDGKQYHAHVLRFLVFGDNKDKEYCVCAVTALGKHPSEGELKTTEEHKKEAQEPKKEDKKPEAAAPAKEDKKPEAAAPAKEDKKPEKEPAKPEELPKDEKKN